MLESLLVRYGYLVLFAGSAIEGDAFLLSAGFLAHQGYLRLDLVIAIAAAGTMAADQVYYHLARSRGQDAFARKAASDPRFERVRGWIGRRGTLLLFLCRFMYGFRIAIPAACGAAGMPPARFTVVNLLGSLWWAVFFGLAGFAFGSAAQVLLADLARYELAIAGALLVGVALLVLLRSHEVRARLLAFRQPAQSAIQFAGRLFTVTHQAGRLALARPHVRVAAFVVTVGLLNIATALFNWRFIALDVLTAWLPLEARHASRAGILVGGVALVAVGRGLARRKRAAWTIAMAAALASIPLHLGHNGAVVRAGLAVWLCWELMRHGYRFTARSDPLRLRHGLVAAPLLALAIGAYGVAGFRRMGTAPTLTVAANLTWQAVTLSPVPLGPRHRAASAFAWSVGALGIAAAAYVFAALLAPVAYRRESAADLAAVSRIAWNHGVDSLSYYAKQPDKVHIMPAADVFVGYRLVKRVAVVAGDPVGPPERIPDAIARFRDRCERNDWVPVFYETSDRWLPAYRDAGLRWFKVGEEAVIQLAGFSLAGSKVAKVRHGVAKVERESPGITVFEYRQDSRDPELDEQLEDVSAEWLHTKGMGEFGFNLGVFSVEDLADKRTMVAAMPDGLVWAFVTWLPYRQGRALVLDAMRRRPHAPASVMDLLIARSALLFKEEGLETVSLATAPLANVDEAAPSRGRSVYDRGVRLIFEHFSAVYGYRSLFHFKKKFNPSWEGRYLVFSRPDLLPRIAYALTAVHISGGIAGALRQLVVSRSRRTEPEVRLKPDLT